MRLFPLLFFACFSALFAAEKIQAPEVVTKVEPNWSNLTSSYLTEIVEVKLVILPSGEPASIAAVSSSIPDNVVRALAQWRFTPFKKVDHPTDAPTETAAIIRVPVRRKLDPDLEHGQSPRWTPSSDLRLALTKAASLDSASAAKLLAELPNAELPDNNRTTLLVYYANKGAADVPTAIKARRDLLLWLIHTYPQDEILSSSYAVVNADGEPLADPASIPLIKEAWLSALKDYPKDLFVAEGAANFLATLDPSAALRILAEKRRWDIQSNVLGALYARAGLGVNSISPAGGNALTASADTLANSGLAYSFRQALLESTDIKLVLAGVDTTTLAAHQLNAHHALPAGYDEYCQALLQHTRSLYPQTTLDCSPTSTSDALFTRVVSADASKANLVKTVEPVYPREAKKKHIFGSVRFLAIVDTTGHIQRLELLSGPLPLYNATYEAVQQWQYKPPVFNGKPAQMSTVVSVDFIAE